MNNGTQPMSMLTLAEAFVFEHEKQFQLPTMLRTKILYLPAIHNLANNLS